MTDLACCHTVNLSVTVLRSSSYYTVVAGIFLVSTGSCRTIHEIKPAAKVTCPSNVLIKLCTCGEGSWHLCNNTDRIQHILVH